MNYPAEPPILPLPLHCTFSPQNWQILAQHWYPIAFLQEVTDKPLAAVLLDQPLVVWRTPGGVTIARDRCPHRGLSLSMGQVRGDQLVCPYHGLHYDAKGHCSHIPAHPDATIPPTLVLPTYPVKEAYGLIWTCLAGHTKQTLPEFGEWEDSDYQQILPDALTVNTSAGRQVEGFLDVSHFAWVHTETFGSQDNPLVPRYEVRCSDRGFSADYWSKVSNFPKGLEHLAPEGFEWRRLFEVFLPFTARLTVFFPEGGQLCILNAASPISSTQTRMFAPICRNFDRGVDLEPVYEFNRQVFAEDQRMIEAQVPKELPLDLTAEVHIPADRSSIAYRRGLRQMGLR
ncbi:MAG: aromatic ring-hydroxylating dioxygenase subunit alpha [Alkalinema sp. RU_4_3]|nr:aromatic ring-hydroxylating dioxygenase subunit alpha [Alkalinema sp. RU_4_3]